MNDIILIQLEMNDFCEFLLIGICAGFLISFIPILLGLGVSGTFKMFRKA